MNSEHDDDDGGQPQPEPGKRERGRPVGSTNRFSREIAQAARQNGKLPHEILLDISRGLPITLYKYDGNGQLVVSKQIEPTPDQLIKCANGAAPYYAPKLSTVEVIQNIDDNNLDRLIELAAAEAGVSLTLGGTREAPEAQDSQGRRRARPAR